MFHLLAMVGGHALAAERDRLPVVIKGANLAAWVSGQGVTIEQIYFYKFNGAWTPVRFQVDKRRRTNLLHNAFSVAEWNALPPESRAALTDVCAYTYFPPNQARCTSWNSAVAPGHKRHCSEYQDDWNSAALHPSDEIVFMARDLADGQRNCPVTWLDPLGAPGLQGDRLEIQINDNGDTFWIYAYRWTSPPPAALVVDGSAPVFTPDITTCLPCPGSSGKNAENICGTVTSPGSSGLSGFTARLASNWKLDSLKVRTPSEGENLLEEFKLKLGDLEDDQNWNCSPTAFKHGYSSPTKVRFIRSVQGAQSGFATVRIDKAYDTLYETEIELRVHDLPSQQLSAIERHTDLTVPQDPDSDPFSAVWVDDGAAPDVPFDRMSKNDGYSSGNPGSVNPEAWTQMMDSAHGGIASYLFEDPRRGAFPAEERDYAYVDDINRHGNFGRTWQRISCMQDGFDNDGGCGNGDPESATLRFKRLWHRFFTLAPAAERISSNVRADDQVAAAMSPIAVAFASQQDAGSSCGGGGGCTPVLEIYTTGEGESTLSNSPSSSPTGCSGLNIAGYGITRQLAGGPEVEIGVVEAGAVFRDRDTRPGRVHTYRSYSISQDGTRSAKTVAASVTPTDTQPPPAPQVSATGMSNGALVEFEACVGRGVIGANVYVSTTSGGPYTKVNAAPIYSPGRTSFVVAGLQNNVTYYIVAKLIDQAGNQSAYSAQVSITPQD
jgi:hypothetical protein